METNKNHKKTGFKVPNDYFTTIENEILSKINAESRVKKTGFEVPETYFSKLDGTILSKIPRDKPKGKVLSLRKKTVQVWLPAAAVLAVLITLWFTLGKDTKTENWHEITGEDVKQWTTDNLIEFNTYEITEMAPNIDLSVNETMDDEAIIDYLSEEDVELLLY